MKSRLEILFPALYAEQRGKRVLLDLTRRYLDYHNLEMLGIGRTPCPGMTCV